MMKSVANTSCLVLGTHTQRFMYLSFVFITDVFQEYSLLDAIKFSMDEHVEFADGPDNFSSYVFKLQSEVKSPYRTILPESLKQFAIMITFRPETRSGGYLFSIVNPLDTVVQLGIHLSAAMTDKWNATLLYTDPMAKTSKKLATFEIPYAKKWQTIAFEVRFKEVVFFYNCNKTETQAVERSPEEMTFDSASTLYLAQAGSIIKGRFEVRMLVLYQCYFFVCTG